MFPSINAPAIAHQTLTRSLGFWFWMTSAEYLMNQSCMVLTVELAANVVGWLLESDEVERGTISHNATTCISALIISLKYPPHSSSSSSMTSKPADSLINRSRSTPSSSTDMAARTPLASDASVVKTVSLLNRETRSSNRQE